MPAVIDHFTRNVADNKMICKLCSTEIVFRSLNEHSKSLKRHLSNKHPAVLTADGPSIPKVSDFCVSRASNSKFLISLKLDRVTIAIRASNHAQPFSFVEDDVFKWGFAAGSFSRIIILSLFAYRMLHSLSAAPELAGMAKVSSINF